MNGDREHFRDIPLSEYRRRRDDTHNRITMAEATFGYVTLKLLVYSGGLLRPLPDVYRMARAYPDPALRPRSSTPLEWDLTNDRPIYTPHHRQIQRGFFSDWTDNDLTDLDHFRAIIPDESVITPPL